METLSGLLEIQKEAKCLINWTQLQKALDNMAIQMNDQLSTDLPIIVGVMLGGLIPMGHLLTRLTFAHEIDYVKVSRYADERVGGDLTWQHYPSADISGRNIVIFDDMLDKGITMAKIKQEFLRLGAKKVLTAVMINKLVKRSSQGLEQADYVGLDMQDKFVYGFGLDYKGFLRSVPGIFSLD